MLRSIHLKDFKSFADEKVQLAPLTVLVGANASGKSNLLEAIRLSQGLGLGFSLTDALQGRWEGGREVWKGIRGGAAESTRSGQEAAQLILDWDFPDRRMNHFLAYAIKPQPHIVYEALEFSPQIEGVKRFVIGRDAPGKQYERTGGLLSEMERLLRDHAHPPNSALLEVILSLRRGLQQLVMLDLVPELMRAYAPKHALELGAQGEHLSSVVWSRSRTHDERMEWVDWLSELCSPEITGLDFIETDLGDVMLVLIEKDGTRTSARALSDGTLRFLGTLVTLRTAPRGSIFLIEELELGLHPQRIHLLVEFLETVTLERGIQVIATTHSPQVLQSLTPQGRNDAVLCARLPGHPGTVLRRFEDIPHFKEVIAKSGIDHLFTTGWLERAL